MSRLRSVAKATVLVAVWVLGGLLVLKVMEIGLSTGESYPSCDWQCSR
jgi:hypothetical protein